MMITRELRQFLLSRSAITAVSDRIYTYPLPQTIVYPAMTFEQESEERVQTFSGATNHIKTTVNIDCWAKRKENASELAEAIASDLDGYRGAMEDRYCHLLRIVNMIELFEDDTKLHRVAITLVINHS